ncbi:DUF948 domain-containing protein [Bacillus shivajii]|uniref:DUF948 domain-containing protein n=1 Tax=Bacillus shivajii TaxID=1983719 RepID=UPI001CFBF423|nr:DUF948 domain-containing protein [Bacillus shivajii]UCZ52315.1 DUF948 domain-containing protein [Bacillus shivajii]
MEWLLYVSVAIIAVAFAFLVFYLIQTLISMRKTIENIGSTVDGLQKQVEDLSEESTQLLHKTNRLADDIQQKSDSLNTVFLAAKDLGDSLQRVNHSVRKVSDAVSSKANNQSEQMAQAVQWGNVALNLWEKWKIKKSETEKRQARETNNEKEEL